MKIDFRKVEEALLYEVRQQGGHPFNSNGDFFIELGNGDEGTHGTVINLSDVARHIAEELGL